MFLFYLLFPIFTCFYTAIVQKIICCSVTGTCILLIRGQCAIISQNKRKQIKMYSLMWLSLMWHKKVYLPKPLCVSVCRCGYYNSLFPLWPKEILKISLKRLQSGQLLREVDGLHSRVGWVPVQLVFQRSVDLIQGAKKNLKAKKKGNLWEMGISV